MGKGICIRPAAGRKLRAAANRRKGAWVLELMEFAVLAGAMSFFFLAPAVNVLSSASPGELAAQDVVSVRGGENDRIAAYIPPLRSAVAATKSDSVSDQTIRAAGRQWLALTREGDLKPLLARTYDEPISEGPKSEIYVACLRLASRLIDVANEERDQGRPWPAAEDYVLSAKVLLPLRYSDFESQGYLEFHMFRALDQIERVSNRLTLQEREAVASELVELGPDPKAFATMAENQRIIARLEARHNRLMQRAVSGMPEGDAVQLDQPTDIDARIKASAGVDARLAKRIEHIRSSMVPLRVRNATP